MGYFIDDDGLNKACTHPEHNPPSMLYVPYGKVYIHECPQCGSCTRLQSSDVTM
jgi:hypothetical protein